MGKLEIGLYDVFTPATMAASPTAADVYDDHLRSAQEAEQLGYKYYFSIEHQTSPISYLSAPNVYLTALARHTSVIRFGVMIYQLPFHNPIRLAQAGIEQGADGRYAGEAGTPERLELRRVFQERAKSYDFWIDNGLALVGSPDTVIRKIQAQHDLIGHDVLCTQHGFGRLAPERVKKSMQLFGEKVIPALA